jgi:site-specific recombinase XerD
MRARCTSKRDLAIFEFLRSTGCRVHEMLFTQVGDLDLEAGRVYLRKTKARIRWKFENGKRVYDGSKVVPRFSLLDEAAVSAVKGYVEERRAEGATDEDTIFTIDQNDTRDGWMVRHIIKNLAKDAGIPDWKHISPHYLRHTWATINTAEGFPTKYSKDLGGWSQKSRTFETIYEHGDLDMMQKLHKRMVEKRG